MLIRVYSGEEAHIVKVHDALISRALALEGCFMSEVHDQLVAALRVIVAHGENPQSVIAHALEDVEREKLAIRAESDEEVPGPYSANPWSMYGG
jgi:hypothetical protein